MAGKTKSKSKKKPAKAEKRGWLGWRTWTPVHWMRRMLRRALWGGLAVIVLAVVMFSVLNPPTTHTMWSEGLRIGEPVDQLWVDAEDIAPVMLRSVVAAEDANFCEHWGFDMTAIRAAIAQGAKRGGSTISQQVAKNVYLWQGRSWVRKALEGVLTPGVELFWSKRRILEVYLNVAEFDEGVFGVEAAARHYFGAGPDELSPRQAALLAAVLPSPKKRNAARPTAFLNKRARSIQDGAETIRRDGRAACFEDT